MIKYLAMDVDGTLTDGKIYMGSEGEALKAFNIKDGYGIHNILPRLGIIPVIVTGRESSIVINRCKEIGIAYIFQNVKDKVSVVMEMSAGQLEQVAYIGDDLNDLAVMEAIKSKGGVVGCPADAARKVINTADFVSMHKGGEGAVREFIEWLENIEHREEVCIENA